MNSLVNAHKILCFCSSFPPITIGSAPKLLSNIEVYYTRLSDEGVSLNGRLEAVMDIDPEVFVSIHCNAIDDNPLTAIDERKHVEGFELFYRDENDLSLAVHIHRLLKRSGLWRKDRGIKQDQEWLDKKLTVLNSLDTPSVLIEIGFLTNPHDLKIIGGNTESIADLIAHGIMDYLSQSERGLDGSMQ